jgi:uncharacterized protein
MPYDIIIGRDKGDIERFGKRGLINIGKGFVKMGNYNSLSNKIWMDIARSHVILVAGKRGSGKSYTLGVIAEELSNLPKEESRNIAPLIFDTMGIFWTMKYENEKDKALLKEWELTPKKLPVKVFVAEGKAIDYKEKGIPFDNTFSLKPSELNPEDWLSIFNLKITSLEGVLIQNSISNLKEKKEFYDIENIQHEIHHNHEISSDIKITVISLFQAAKNWGIFSETEKGIEIKDLINPGITSIIDLSIFSSTSTFNIRALVISLISRKLFQIRLESRKNEEIESIRHGAGYLSYDKKLENPLIWLFIDEAHEFLPNDNTTPATNSLIQILREGRQPGISIVLATQQPGQIHRDVMTQSDIVISHRVTAQPDVKALNMIMQTYLLSDIQKQLDDLPSLKGSAIILDDNSERIYPIKIKPKLTWHGGEAPTAVKAEVKL